MSYTVLARRYRSQSFDDVVGQQPIAQTLKNAIATGRVAHAYLFCGTRGVGKTSMARIFARALNAPDTVPGVAKPDDYEYPPIDVQQRTAEAVMRGDDLNVIEIDGASNRGVDDSRQLIANASLAPAGNARYKIYIIDEVHQLTKDAFNALLKLMEEPPSHVKFILATTEPQKVLATIQSRCQRFDFRNIPTLQIAEHLKTVLANEQIEADAQVVWQIARLANGSMRDGLSLMDRLIATGESPITPEILDKMLGLPPQERVVELVNAFAAGDVAASLQQTDALLGRGIALDQVIEVLIDRFRQLMLILACGADSELIELSDDAKAQAAEQAKQFDTAGLVHMIALCENLARYSRDAANPRAMLDATIVRLALAEKMADVSALLAGGSVSVGPAGQKKKPVSPPPDERSPHVAVTQSTPPPLRATTPPPVQVSTDDPAAIWSAVLNFIADRNALSWITGLKLEAIENNRATFTIQPGRRELHRFVQERQLQQLQQVLQDVTGRRLRPQLQKPADPTAPPPSADTSQSQDAAAQREVLSLPLVKQVVNLFDAEIVHVRDDEDAAEG